MTQATFSLQNHNPDVITCIANLSSDEVFTPPEFANLMLDNIERAYARDNDGENLWENKELRFLDPCTKSGVYLREIVKRLNNGLTSLIPDLTERIDHILTKQVYGIGITELTSLLARRSLYCSKNANGIHSVARTFQTDSGNVWFEKLDHTWSSGKCKFCNASASEHQRSQELESYAYAFIHSENIKLTIERMFGESMKFDVIIGNPPYQLNDGGFGTSAMPIYHKFVEQAKKLEPKYLSFVIPSRWLSGGKGLSDFRSEMLNDDRIEHITDYLNSKECFPGVSIGGGVCYFLWNRDYKGSCEYTNILNKTPFTLQRMLNKYPVFIRFNQAVSIIEKLGINEKDSFSTLVDSRNPFGIASNFRGQEKDFKGSLSLFSSEGVSYIKRELVTSGSSKIGLYKLMVGRIISEHAGEPDKNGQMKILSTIRVLSPNEVCTDSYLCVGEFQNEKDALNVQSYLKTKFVRFLIMQALSSINLSKEKFYFIPLVDFSKNWSDISLYKKFNLSTEEIDFIESTIKEME